MVHLRPVGPLPSAVYWRRRLVVLVVPVLALVGLRACSGSEASTETLAVPTPTPTPATAAEPAPASSPAAEPVPAPAPVACADVDLTVTATTDVETYELGQTPRLRLSVVNSSGVPCVRDVGPGAVELRVLSGEDRIWSSDDCAPGGDPGTQELAPGQEITVEVPWAGRRSLPECSGPMARALPGTYRVVGTVGPLEVQGAAFRLVIA